MQSLLIHLLSILITTISSLSFVASTTEFVFNTNFNSTNLVLFGDATITQHSSSSILSLTNDSTTFSMGRALYPFKLNTTTNSSSSRGRTPLPFSTSFIFSISQVRGFQPGHGFAFILAPTTGLGGASSAQHLALFNFSNNGDPNNHVLAVEFDVFKNEEFRDIDDNHVGLNLNSLTSAASNTAGFWDGPNDDHFQAVDLNDGVNYQVWIDCADSRVNVTLGVSGRRRPRRPLISHLVSGLSAILRDEMYVGFTAATGQLVQSHRILAWSFSNTNASIGDALVTLNLPSFVVSSRGGHEANRGLIAGVVVVICVFVVVVFFGVWMVVRRRKRKGDEDGLLEEVEDWETEYWPHRIGYKEIRDATGGFSDENVIGFGGNGKVYRGVLGGGDEVAVKRISVKDEQGMREFVAEISSLGRLRHRNLVGLKGWCKRDKASLILVYDYMHNGSLDKRVFECGDGNERMLLSWGERVKALKDVANGILYLHEGWEVTVLHRDIKASNVLLDKEMNARLGDFGLAKMHGHGELSTTTRVVGTVGYMAPEVVHTGRASTQTDVFGFGVLVLEVVSGRRPVQDGMPGLVEWVWGQMEAGDLLGAADKRVMGKGAVESEEIERVLHLGLACVSHDPNARPSMSQVVKVLEGKCVESAELISRFSVVDKSRWNSGGARGRFHPTFEDVRDAFSSSASLSDSDVLRIGR